MAPTDKDDDRSFQALGREKMSRLQEALIRNNAAPPLPETPAWRAKNPLLAVGGVLLGIGVGLFTILVVWFGTRIF